MTIGPNDYRITTRYLPKDPMSSFFATIHEIGHSLYEQGLPVEYWGTPRGEAVSSGIHESQSLFWENRVGRSKAFTNYWYPQFKKNFPSQFKGASEDGFYHAVNKVAPSYTRVEVDEVCYSLHIILRYEIERDLINGKLEVADIPEIWNKKMIDYLAITPQNDVQGCLQDVHWSEGLFGYFPSYALGHLISAQFVEKMEQDIGSLEKLIESQRFDKVLSWLRVNIHTLGRSYEAPELIQKISGKSLSEKPFLDYLKKKYI